MKKLALAILIVLLTAVQAWSLSVVRLGPEYFPESDRSRALANGYIYVGEPDADPSIPANQKTLSVQQENGTIVAVTQPIRTNAGGVPVYNGSPVTLLVDGNYSLLVQNSLAAQEYYVPSIDGGPVSGNLSDYGCNFDTAVTQIGSVIDTHLIIDCDPDDLTSNVNVTENITLEWRRGYPLGGPHTLTISGTIIAGEYLIFESDLSVLAPDSNSLVKVAWWGDPVEAVQSNAKVIRHGVDQTYVINEGVILSDGQTYMGEGWTSVLQVGSSFSGDTAVANSDQVNGNSNLTVKDIKIFGNGENTEGISFLGNENLSCKIENVWVDYTLDRAIVIQNGKYSTITKNKVTRFGAIVTDGQSFAVGDDAIRFAGTSNNCIVSENYIDNSGLIVEQHGDNLTYGRHGITIGISVIDTVLITNNVIKTVERHGINMEGPAADKCVVLGNKVFDAGTWGIVVTGEQTIVMGNHIEDSGQAGLLVGGDVGGHNIVHGNIVVNAGFDPLDVNTTNNFLSGVVSESNGRFYDIQGNTVIGSAGHGIFLEQGSGVCDGNKLFDNVQGGIQIASENWSVSNNRAINNTTFGINISNATVDALLSGNYCTGNSTFGIDVGSSFEGAINSNYCKNNTSGDYDNLTRASQALGNIGDTGAEQNYADSNTDIGVPLYRIAQNDVNEGFIDYRGSQQADLSGNITTLNSGATTGHVKIEINGNQRWIPFVTTPN